MQVKAFLVIMLGLVVSLILAPIVISNAVTAATTTGIGSFAGVAAVIGLVPLGFVLLAAWYAFKHIKGNKGD